MKGIITRCTNNTIDFKEDGKVEMVFKLADWVKPEFFKMGRADITLKDNLVSFISMEGQEKKKQEDYKENWTDDMTSFEDLLNAAHEKYGNLFNIKTELISMDYEKKQAMFSACVSVEVSDGARVFTGHGDAEGITNDLIKLHFIRMAETRAISRALRWATNNAKVTAEEK